MNNNITPENLFVRRRWRANRQRVIKSNTQRQVQKTFSWVNSRDWVDHSRWRYSRQRVIKANPKTQNETSNWNWPSKEARLLEKYMRENWMINEEPNTLNNYKTPTQIGDDWIQKVKGNWEWYIQKEKMTDNDKKEVQKSRDWVYRKIEADDPQKWIWINMSKKNPKWRFKRYFFNDWLVHILDNTWERVVDEYMKKYRKLTMFIKNCLENRDRKKLVDNYSDKINLFFLEMETGKF